MAIPPYLDGSQFTSAPRTSRSAIVPAIAVNPNTLAATGGAGVMAITGIPPYLDKSQFTSAPRTSREDFLPIVLINPQTLEPYVAGSGGGGGGVGSVGVQSPPLENTGTAADPVIGFQDGNNAGEVWTWNGTSWVLQIPSGGTAVSIDNLTDVDTTTTPPSNGDVLTWDGTNWVPQAPSGGGAGGINVVDTTAGATAALVMSNDTAIYEYMTLTQDITITIDSDGLTTSSAPHNLVIRQDATGGHTITWATSAGDTLEWYDGAEVAVDLDPDAVSLVSFYSMWDGANHLVIGKAI